MFKIPLLLKQIRQLLMVIATNQAVLLNLQASQAKIDTVVRKAAATNACDSASFSNKQIEIIATSAKKMQ